MAFKSSAAFELEKAICAAVGVRPELVTRLELVMTGEDPPKVTVEMVPDMGELEKLTRTFEFTNSGFTAVDL